MVRRAAAGTLVVIVWLLAPFAVAGLWGRDRLLETDGWVELAAQLPEDARARSAVSAELTDVVLDSLGIGNQIRRRAEPVVREAADRALASETFAVIWVDANRTVHTQLVRQLESDDRTPIRFDLRPALAIVLDTVEEPIAAVVPLPGDVPELGSSPTPEEADAAITAALGRTVPADRSTVVVLRGDRVTTARTVYRGVDRGAFLLAAITLAIAAVAIALAQRRWTTAAATGIGSALTLLIGWVAARGVGSVIGRFLGEGVGRAVVESVASVAADDLGRRYLAVALVLGLAGVACAVVAAVLARRA